jgi:hypothetical protein
MGDVSRYAAVRATALLLALFLAGCGAVQAGGQYSGVPDSTVGDWRFPAGTLSTGGRINLNREVGR